MFKFFKDKLKSWIGKSKETIEETAEKVEEKEQEVEDRMESYENQGSPDKSPLLKESHPSLDTEKPEKKSKKEKKVKPKKKAEKKPKKEKKEKKVKEIPDEELIEEKLEKAEEEKEIPEETEKEEITEEDIDKLEETMKEISGEALPMKFEPGLQKYTPDTEKIEEEKEEKVEKLNTIDEEGNITGEESREKIHGKGLLHREINVLVYNNKGEILFQKRAPNKDTFPNLFDASTGGHVDIGEDYLSAAIRELEEETRIKAKKSDLILLGEFKKKVYDKVTNKTNYATKEIYAYRFKGDKEELIIEQGEATNLKFLPIKTLFNPSKKEKEEFIPTLLSKEYLIFYKKIEELIKGTEESIESISREAPTIEELEHEKKPTFFKRLKERFSYKLSEEDFENIFENLELLLLENNVALEATEAIKKQIKENLVGKEIKKDKLEEEIQAALKKAIENLLLEPDDILSLIKEKQPFVFVFFGINGTGKCIHEDSNIILSRGNIIPIKRLYGDFAFKLKEQNLEDGKIIDISSENLFVPSFNSKTLKIENKKATHLWKLKKKELIQINLDNGNDYSIKVTPEHPFFILRDGEVVKMRADEIKETDHVSIPNKTEIKGETQSLIKEIKELDLFIYLSPEEAKEIVLSKYKTIKEAHQKLKFKKNYCQLTTDIKKGKIPIELIKRETNFLKIKEYKSNKIITIPSYLTSNFAEFLGYVMGDGHIEKGYVEITTQDKEIIQRMIELSKILFNIVPTIKKEKRRKNLYKIILMSKTLVELLRIFNLKPGKKGKRLQVPSQIKLSDDETVRSFIRAYFDCEGSPSRDARYIELTSESKILIQQINLLLKRFGIVSTISEKKVQEISYWRLSINSRYAEYFAERIGALINYKKEKMQGYSRIGKYQGCGKQDMIPLGKSLKQLRLQLGFSIAEIQKYVPGYQIYEKKGIISKERLILLTEYYKRKKLGIFYYFLKSLSENNIKRYPPYLINGITTQLKSQNLISIKDKSIRLTNNGQTYLQIINQTKLKSKKLLETFEYLSNSNVCWIPLKDIKKIVNDSNFVYDLTVEDNHSFIAEGFVVHNTTTIAKFANLLQENNISCVLAAADTFRAASIEQLEHHAKKLKIKLIKHDYGADPAAVGFDAIKHAKAHNIQVVLIDTAGRMHTQDNLLSEMEKICRVTDPDMKIFVAESIAGNDAIQQAKKFNDTIGIDASILTKADVDEKGGTAISISYVTKKPILYLGTGQEYKDLELFDPEKFVKELGL